MSKPANKTVIGLFVLGAIALVVIAIVVLGSGKFFKRTFTAVCFFEGGVKGLNEGSPVVFRGVKIGSVTRIVLTFNTKDLAIKIPVFIEIDPSHFKPIGPVPVGHRPGQSVGLLIERGLRASLEMQSIVTGQMQVGLDFYPDKPAIFVGAEPDYQEIPTVQTGLQELAKKIEKLPIEEIFEKLLAAVEGVEKIINSPEVKGIISSLNLAVEDASKLVKDVDAHVAPLATGLGETIREARKLVQNVNTQVQPLASSIKGAAGEYGKLARNVDSQIEPLASSIEKSLKEVRAAVEQARKALAGAEGVLAEDSPLLYELESALKEVSDAARAIRLLADYLKRHPEALLKGKGKSEGE
jgi:paraquat-inducible protein B